MLLCFFLGNDFLPHLPALNIYTTGLDIIIFKYVSLMSKYQWNRFFITISDAPIDVQIDSELFVELLLGLGEVENRLLVDAFKAKRRKPHCPFKNPYDIEKFKIENLDFPFKDPVMLGHGKSEHWRERFYSYYGIRKATSESDKMRYQSELNHICQQYLLGIKFIAQYYFIGCPSWEWFYPYDFPPFLNDLQCYVRHEEFRFDALSFELGAPMKPLHQLLTILPVAASHLLPKALQALITNPLTQLAQLYPVNFPVDLLYKTKFWQGVPMLPRLNPKLLKAVFETNEQYIVDPEQRKRNEVLDCFEFQVW